MVGILIRMKLATLRNMPVGIWNWKTAVGLGLALITILLATADETSPSITTGLLAMAFGSWTLGWVLAPIQTGAGTDEPLMPEHFALLPIPSHKLAFGLLVTTFVGIGPLVTLFAFTSLTVFGLRLGVIPTLVGLAAMVLQLTLPILLSRVVIGAASAAMKSRFGIEFAALQYAIIISLSTVGWVIPAALARNHDLFTGPKALVSDNLPSSLWYAVRILPSGWGPVAVQAARDSHWMLMFACLGGLLILDLLLLLIWSEQLSRRITGRGANAATQMVSLPVGTSRMLPETPLGSAVQNEIRNWFREPRNALELRIAILASLFIVAIPAAVNWTAIVPWVGTIIALLAAACACNLYGIAGSSFWLTLMTPGAEKNDVRGKQLAFLAVFAPAAILFSTIFTAWGEQTWAWPWILSIMPATLGAAAGVMIVISIRGVVPVPETARKSGNLMAAADNTAQTFVAMIATALAAIPPAAVVFSGRSLDSRIVEWFAVPIGVGTGALAAWWGGSWAIRDLEREGPELLSILRYGKRASTRATTGGLLDGLPKGRNGIIVLLCWSTFWLPLFPQGLLPLFLKLIGTETKSWCLALYLPDAYQWPVIFGMIALGAILAAVATALQLREPGPRD
ncbi:MAG TPA: hypothetical protein VFQ54_11630 [Thermomicrobiales bacterium]|nr:hypothetical protein [Thermomicrobiales bacterium]